MEPAGGQWNFILFGQQHLSLTGPNTSIIKIFRSINITGLTYFEPRQQRSSQ
jgi:hypothetical protein